MLTAEQEKLLYTIGLYSTGEEGITWVKEHALDSLIYYLIERRVFEEYNYFPKLKFWGNTKRYVNKSPKAKKDVATLIDKRFLDRLKINTVDWGFLFAYRVTSKGEKRIKEIGEETKERVDNVLQCPKCGTIMEVRFRNATPTFFCPDCEYTPVKCPECDEKMEFEVRNGIAYKVCQCGNEIKPEEKDISGIIWKVKDVSYESESLV